MQLTPAEQQLVSIIRAAKGRDLTITVLVRGDRYTVRLATSEGGPGEGIGIGNTFDEAWSDITPAHQRRARA
jgi:hypothetical protein